MSYRALIFDFDLTLADSSAGFVDSHRFAAHAMGLPEPDALAVARTIGTPLPLAVPMLYTIDPATTESYIDIYQQRANEVMTDLTIMLDGANETLHKLHSSGYMLGIVSQKLRYRVEAVLNREGLLGTFAVVLGGDDTPAFKPDPRGLLLAIERAGSTPAESIYTGDTTIDADCARRANVPFVAVLTGPSAAEEFASYPSVAILPSVRELPAFLAI